MSNQSMEGFTTSIWDFLVAKIISGQSLATPDFTVSSPFINKISIGGLASDVDWGNAFPDKHNGNNLKITPNTSNTVKVLHGTIWDGTHAITFPSDTIVGVAQPITFPGIKNFVYTREDTPNAINLDVQTTSTPPVGTKTLAGIVIFDTDSGKILFAGNNPVMVNKTFETTSLIVDGRNWNKSTEITDVKRTHGGTNAFRISTSFLLPGTNKIGEFALEGNISYDSNVSIQSKILAYLALQTQVLAVDVNLVVNWDFMINAPGTFY